MSEMQEFDLAIVGGGLVGAALALSLRDANLRIALIDFQASAEAQLPTQASDSVENFQPRVSALTLASVAMLNECGVWDQLSPELVMPYQRMQVWDELGTASILFDSAELHCDELGYIVENQHVVSAMHQALLSQSNISCFWQHSLEGMTLASDGTRDVKLVHQNEPKEIKVKLVIGADGAMSRVRQMSTLPTREWDYEHQAIVCTVKTEKSHDGIARQRFSEDGPLAFLPLKNQHNTGEFSSIVWSLKPDRVAHWMAADNETFMLGLEKAIEGQLGKVIDVSKRYSFPLRQRHAKRYVGEAVALVGDAAHTIHPLAGQGVNLGFKDVAVLSRCIKEASAKGYDINHSVVLNRYQRERQGDNLLMMGAMEGFKQLFGSDQPLLRWARNTGLSWVNKQGFIKNQLAKHAMGLDT